MSTFSIFDMLGDPVRVDDWIVYSFTYGNSVEMRIGQILDLITTVPKYTTSSENHYLKVDWKITTAYALPEKPTKIRVQPGTKGAFLKVENDKFN